MVVAPGKGGRKGGKERGMLSRSEARERYQVMKEGRQCQGRKEGRKEGRKWYLMVVVQMPTRAMLQPMWHGNGGGDSGGGSDDDDDGDRDRKGNWKEEFGVQSWMGRKESLEWKVQSKDESVVWIEGNKNRGTQSAEVSPP